MPSAFSLTLSRPPTSIVVLSGINDESFDGCPEALAYLSCVVFLLELGDWLCNTSGGEVRDTDSNQVLQPSDPWLDGTSKFRRFAYAPPPQQLPYDLPYWKDITTSVHSSMVKNGRHDFDAEATTALYLRTFNRCTLSGTRQRLENCHLLPACRGRVLTPVRRARGPGQDHKFELSDGRNGIRMEHRLHVDQEKGKLGILPLPTRWVTETGEIRTVPITIPPHSIPSHYRLLSSNSLLPHILNLHNSPPHAKFEWSEEYDGDTQRPYHWVIEYATYTRWLGRYAHPAFVKWVREQQQEMSAEYDDRADSVASTRGSARTSVVDEDEDGGEEDEEKREDEGSEEEEEGNGDGAGLGGGGAEGSARRPDPDKTPRNSPPNRKSKPSHPRRKPPGRRTAHFPVEPSVKVLNWLGTLPPSISV